MKLPAIEGTAARMIEVALAEVGYVETPDNITKYGKAMNADGLPWCGSFINFCAKQARVDIPNVVSTIAGAASGMTYDSIKDEFGYPTTLVE